MYSIGAKIKEVYGSAVVYNKMTIVGNSNTKSSTGTVSASVTEALALLALQSRKHTPGSNNFELGYLRGSKVLFILTFTSLMRTGGMV